MDPSTAHQIFGRPVGRGSTTAASSTPSPTRTTWGILRRKEKYDQIPEDNVIWVDQGQKSSQKEETIAPRHARYWSEGQFLQ